MPLLDVEGVTVRFGGHLAVSEVDLAVEMGAVTGLIGPNGAGKTTLFNVITGLQGVESGRVRFDGRDISKLPTHKRARLGMARTFQRLELFGSLTARENLVAAAEFRRGHRNERPEVVAARLIDRIGLQRVADVRADALPTGQARLVELGRALATAPRLVLLDEPASGLDDNETDTFGELLTELAADGLGILLVEHDMSLVMLICSRITVLDFGSVLAVGSPEEIRSNEAVLTAYLGRPA